jgi:N,N'-diacetyllegionaminate synthase
MKMTFEKSLVSLIDIPAGTQLTNAMIGAKKPGTGISAARYSEIIGQKTTRNIPKDTLISESDLNL